ncbi:hypothetical protein DFH07DRAFT_589025 [Mycena maculata]|uniref:Uncharacterized protein n=1 Tax=Mycena maculata TaxID=230809 RepID=A0AAD7INH2_9AGAR|nr:hypothetical protein DFH07DRAFT_589025 [Mycena maculata]
MIKFTHLFGYLIRHERGEETPFTFPSIGAWLRESTSELGATQLRSFSISRVASWTALGDWDVVQLDLNLAPAHLSILKGLGPSLPRLSSLDITLPTGWAVRAIHMDDFASFFDCLPALRTLRLKNGYLNLHTNGQAPWKPVQQPIPRVWDSGCIRAHKTMVRYLAQAVQQARALDLIHISDIGFDGHGVERRPWALQVSYRVRPNASRDLDIVGTPMLEIDPLHLPKN